MKLDRPELRHALSAEYVLGSLRGAARRRFASHAAAEPGLAATVAQWEAFLTPLAGKVTPVEPPARVWREIERRIAARPIAAHPSAGAVAKNNWWDSLAFWRNWGLAATGMAAALVVAFIVVRPEPAVAPAPVAMVAVLSTPENVPRMIVERQGADLMIKMVKPWKTLPTNDLELWVIPAQGAPRSLGVVAYDKDSRLTMANLDARLADGTAFAISREPKGGSPTGAPTGPVLCSGAIAKMPPPVRT